MFVQYRDSMCVFYALSIAILIAMTLAPNASAFNLTTEVEVLAHAEADECFQGIGQNSLGVQPPCPEGSQEKVNQAYVWGKALANNKIFFGTVANVNCLVIGTFLQSTVPTLSDAYVCEFGESPMVPPVPAALGDYRPPNLYAFDRESGELTDLSSVMPVPERQRLAATLGIRAAGALDGVVLFAGLSLSGGVNFFAFSDQGVFLGAATKANYTNIRKFKAIGEHLYAGLGFADDTNVEGRILKWVGDLANPIDFEVVGVVDTEVAELAEHEGRVFVTTWPQGGKEAALYMSPEIGVNGLQDSDPSNWERVFTVSDYEPSPISAALYGLGALASFDGYLFWGTMHVPGTGVAAHSQVLSELDEPERRSLEADELLLAERAISIFRGRDFETGDPGERTPIIELLYGYEVMPVLDPDNGAWSFEQNEIGFPIFGGPGFNNIFNNYTWTMEVFDDRLWVGTMDVGGLLAYGTGLLTEEQETLAEQAVVNVLASTLVGADLWFFPSADSPAIPETLSGAGNPANYGFRTMETDGDYLFLGTANPMNLLTEAEDRSQGRGGWELLSLSPKADNTGVGENITVIIDEQTSVTFCKVITPGITNVFRFGGSEEEAALLAVLNEAALGELGADTDDGIGASQIQDLYVFATNAEWSDQGDCASEPVVLNVSFDEPLFSASLARVSFDFLSGTPDGQDITLVGEPIGTFEADPLPGSFSNAIRGDLSEVFGGIIILVSEVPPAGIAAQITIEVGDDQAAVAGTEVETAPSVVVTDANGNPVAGVEVTFAVASGGGTVSPSTAITTDADGIAAVDSWTLGTTVGENTLVATSTELLPGSPLTFTATGTVGAPAAISIQSGTGQSAEVGTEVEIAPSVLVTDSNGNPVAGVEVTFAVTSGGGTVSPSTPITTDADGIAAADSWTLGTTVGDNTVTATAAGLAGSPVTFTSTGTAGAAAQITIQSGTGQSAEVGTEVETAPSVLVTDANGNPVAGVEVTFAVTSGGGTVSPSTAVTTDADGIAAADSWVLGTLSGENTLAATAAGLAGNPVTFTATATPRPAIPVPVNSAWMLALLTLLVLIMVGVGVSGQPFRSGNSV